jgi:hypothetical protein
VALFSFSTPTYPHISLFMELIKKSLIVIPYQTLNPTGEWAEGGNARGRGLSTGRWRSSTAGIAAGGLWVRDWGGEVVLCVRDIERKLLGSLNRSLDQRRGREKRGKNSPERGKTVALRELRSGEGRRVVAEAVAGKEVPGATFL